MRRIIFIVIFNICLFITNTALARIFIPIDQPVDKKFPIAVADLASLEGGGAGGAATKIADIIRNDLTLSGYFFVIPKKAYLEKNRDISADTIDFKKWTMLEAKALVKGAIKKEEGRIVVQLKLFDTYDREMLVGKQYTFESKDLRKIAHRFSDEVMLALTSIRGVFGTQIAFTSQTGKRTKSIYVMDMDGENMKRVTKDKSISIGPAWSPDGSSLVFASYLSGFPDIFVADLKTGHNRQLTTNRSTNIAPAWSPSGSWIAYSSSQSGNMEIYAMSPAGENNRKITQSFGIDISPSFSPEGNEIIYSSERGGNVHLYRKSLQGGDSVRVTFVGSQNDSPDWSPDGQRITFCGRTGDTFDIFTVGIDGSGIQRLTIGGGTNEHPKWSPDGRFIVFSSSRDGGPHIYMMRYDGANQIRLNKKGNGITPDWGPWEN